jgi:hypothetical protein
MLIHKYLYQKTDEIYTKNFCIIFMIINYIDVKSLLITRRNYIKKHSYGELKCNITRRNCIKIYTYGVKQNKYYDSIQSEVKTNSPRSWKMWQNILSLFV